MLCGRVQKSYGSRGAQTVSRPKLVAQSTSELTLSYLLFTCLTCSSSKSTPRSPGGFSSAIHSPKADDMSRMNTIINPLEEHPDLTATTEDCHYPQGGNIPSQRALAKASRRTQSYTSSIGYHKMTKLTQRYTSTSIGRRHAQT